MSIYVCTEYTYIYISIYTIYAHTHTYSKSKLIHGTQNRPRGSNFLSMSFISCLDGTV